MTYLQSLNRKINNINNYDHFEAFVIYVVLKWGQQLGSIPNKTIGGLAESYICRKIKKQGKAYRTYISPGSWSPSDIFAIARKKYYWHIALIQVKSSKKKNEIVILNDDQVEDLQSFAQFFMFELKESSLLDETKIKSVLVSTGYCGVMNIEYKIKGKISVNHKLIDSFSYQILTHNTTLSEEKQTFSSLFHGKNMQKAIL